MYRRSVILLALLALLGMPLAVLAAGSSPAPAAAAGVTYFVSYLGSNVLGNGTAGAPWRTISYAVSMANSGDAIMVADDNNEDTDDYVENVVVDKGVQIMSQDQMGARPQLRASSPLAPALKIAHADGVTIKGLDIYGASQRADMGAPGYSERAGVHASCATGLVIEDCRIGWDAEHTNLNGVYLTGCDDCIVRRNIISASLMTGIYLADTYNTTVMENACNLNGEHGIALQLMSARITIMGNSFNQNRGDGIVIGGNGGVTVVGNTVSNNGGFGIQMGLTGGHSVYLNSFSDNGRGNAMNAGAASSWASPQAVQYMYGSERHTGIVGNYWSDYAGSDNGTGGRTAGDGIGDTDLPYASVYGVSDSYPLMTVLGVKADFSVSVAAGIAPLDVQFTDRSVGEVLTWAWDLNGDDITDNTTQNPAFTYEDPGVYTVTLTVTGKSGADIRSRRACVLVIDALAWTTVDTQSATTIESSNGVITLQVPAGTTSRAFTLVITKLSEDDVAPATPGIRFGDTFFAIDGAGELRKEVTINARYSDADLAAADGDPDRLTLSCYDPLKGEWLIEDTTVDPDTRTVSTSAAHFSRWAIVAREEGAAGGSGFPGWAWGIVAAAGALVVIALSALLGYKCARR